MERFRQLVDVLLDSELPFKESSLGGGEWQVPLAKRQISGGSPFQQCERQRGGNTGEGTLVSGSCNWLEGIGGRPVTCVAAQKAWIVVLKAVSVGLQIVVLLQVLSTLQSPFGAATHVTAALQCPSTSCSCQAKWDLLSPDGSLEVGSQGGRGGEGEGKGGTIEEPEGGKCVWAKADCCGSSHYKHC